MLIALLLLAQQPPDAALFNKARAHMATILVNQPNYTCLETIDRSERAAKPKSKFDVVDSLRFEVAFVDKREMYAWPGSKTFGETDILDMVPEGAAIATGAFAGHAQYLFRTTMATIKKGEWIEETGQRYARFPFTVPADRSRYQLMKSKANSAVVGYSGDIWIDPAVERVTRLSFHADDIPAKLGMQSTATTIEYASAKIGANEFWLPARSIEEITDAAGRTDRNVTRFSGCRAFTGESTLRFDEVPADDPNAAPPMPPQPIDLPPGIWFELQFDGTVDSANTHVGDLVPASLTSDIKQKGHLLFAKGTPVELRLIRLQRHPDMISMEFVAAEITSKTSTAKLVAIPEMPQRPRTQTGLPQYYGDGRRPGIGIFFTRGTRLTLRKGYRAIWRTIPPPERVSKPEGPGSN